MIMIILIDALTNIIFFFQIKRYLKGETEDIIAVAFIFR